MVELALQLFLNNRVKQGSIIGSMGTDLSNWSGSSPCPSWLVLPLLVYVRVPAVLLGVSCPVAPDFVDLWPHRLPRLSSFQLVSHPAGGAALLITPPPVSSVLASFHTAFWGIYQFLPNRTDSIVHAPLLIYLQERRNKEKRLFHACPS